MRSSSRRRECIRRDRRASCALPLFGGIRGPDMMLVREYEGLLLVTYVWRRCGALEVGLNRTVLLVEEGHVRDEVLDNVHVR
jgi:hypothetical protein